VATENAQKRGGQEPGSASENTTALPRRRRRSAPLELPDPQDGFVRSRAETLGTCRFRPSISCDVSRAALSGVVLKRAPAPRV
jgi:hypothetical protein